MKLFLALLLTSGCFAQSVSLNFAKPFSSPELHPHPPNNGPWTLSVSNPVCQYTNFGSGTWINIVPLTSGGISTCYAPITVAFGPATTQFSADWVFEVSTQPEIEKPDSIYYITHNGYMSVTSTCPASAGPIYATWTSYPQFAINPATNLRDLGFAMYVVVSSVTGSTLLTGEQDYFNTWTKAPVSNPPSGIVPCP